MNLFLNNLVQNIVNFIDLKKLTIARCAANKKLTDEIFYHFDFPKLRYLNCFAPEVMETYFF